MVGSLVDLIERSLQDIADALQNAWAKNACLACPLGELSALAAATLVFYRENHHTTQQPSHDHWTNHVKKRDV